MATLFFWAVLGALAGAFAKLVLWDNRRESWLATMLLSIGGGLAGGYLRVYVGGAASAGVIPLGFDGFSILLALLGATLPLIAYYLMFERRPAAREIRRQAA